MPRLIDADKVRTKLVYFTCSTGIDEAPYEFASDIIDKEPTVEAIPMEWLEKKIEKCKSSKDLYPQLFEEIMTIVIAEWRKENEIERCR